MRRERGLDVSGPAAAYRAMDADVIISGAGMAGATLALGLARGGLKPCDLIERVGDKAVRNASEVQLGVDRGKVGEPLAITVLRNGSRQNLIVRPAELPREG